MRVENGWVDEAMGARDRKKETMQQATCVRSMASSLYVCTIFFLSYVSLTTAFSMYLCTASSSFSFLFRPGLP